MNTPCKAAVLPSAARKSCRAWASWIILSILGCVPVASATDVVFSDGGFATAAGPTVTLTMYNIGNESPHASGTLRMELWAFSSPYNGAPGAILNGYRLAVSPSLGTLNADSSFTTSPIALTVPFSLPPTGVYYASLFLTEYQGSSDDEGYVSVASVNFPNTVNIYQVGVSHGGYFGFSTAIYVGSGYFYDSDVGYIYSFNDGWIYVSNLNKYFYVDSGDNFTTGIYLYDLAAGSWTYTEQSFWPYVYYFDGTGWVDTGLN